MPLNYRPVSTINEMGANEDDERPGLRHCFLAMSLPTTDERSALMKSVRRENTGPEKAVRRLLWDTGARYRVNVSDLAGSPDIANKSRRKAVFVHGCFWHFHEGCDRATVPDRNRSYWEKKFRRNKERDVRKEEALQDRGFDVLVIWECQLADPSGLREKLKNFWFDNRG